MSQIKKAISSNEQIIESNKRRYYNSISIVSKESIDSSDIREISVNYIFNDFCVYIEKYSSDNNNYLCEAQKTLNKLLSIDTDLTRLSSLIDNSLIFDGNIYKVVGVDLFNFIIKFSNNLSVSVFDKKIQWRPK